MELMSVESSTAEQSAGELAAFQDILESNQIAFTDTLTDEIETVIAEASRLQRYEYVVGTVTDYGVSSNDHAHFDLIHDGEPLHCVVFASRRSSIPAINSGQQVAVAGDVSFHPPENRCSIEVDEVVPFKENDTSLLRRIRSNRQAQIALAVVVLLVLVLGGIFLLL